jgi:hypothetical protein
MEETRVITPVIGNATEEITVGGDVRVHACRGWGGCLERIEKADIKLSAGHFQKLFIQIFDIYYLIDILGFMHCMRGIMYVRIPSGDVRHVQLLIL